MTPQIGQEGDDRKYRSLRKSDFYAAKAAVDAEKREVKVAYCSTCGREIGIARKNFNDYCLQCSDE